MRDLLGFVLTWHSQSYSARSMFYLALSVNCSQMASHYQLLEFISIHLLFFVLDNQKSTDVLPTLLLTLNVAQSSDRYT